MWEVSGDRTGFSNPVDGAARSQAWLLLWRTSMSGRLNGCLNTERFTNKGQLTPGGGGGGKRGQTYTVTRNLVSSQQKTVQSVISDIYWRPHNLNINSSLAKPGVASYWNKYLLSLVSIQRSCYGKACFIYEVPIHNNCCLSIREKIPTI